MRPHVLLLTSLLLLPFGLGSAQASPPRHRAHARPATVAGIYRTGNKALGSELEVEELPGKRIKFSLYSFWRTPDGTACNGSAEGIINLKNGVAVYQEKDPDFAYTLTFRFSPSSCTVECDHPSHFGGFNVDPTGTYKKVSRKFQW